MASSGFQQGLSQNLSQQQTLSPQMRQSLQILQSSSLELSQLLTQITESNPTLELSTDSEQLEDTSPTDSERDYENLSEFDDHWREDRIMMHGSTQNTSDDTERRDHLYNSIVAPKTLQQHLLDQLNHSAVEDELHTATEHLIGSLDYRGFLEDTLENLTTSSPHDLKVMQRARALIQSFEPPGIGVENLTESLLLQLQRSGKGATLESRIVAEHLEDLAKRKIPTIARSLGVSQDAINAAAERISHLNADPASAFDATSNPHITPDIEILTDEFGDYYANLTGEHLPNVRISDHYKDLLSRLNNNPKARNFIRNNIHEGRQIINAIGLRQETLLKIGSELIKRQPEFLAVGTPGLRPMTMHDIAETIGVHPATISRAVAGKYIHTPHGLMELRSFFASGYTTKQGAEVSNTSVRETIQKIVSSEDTAKPFSDTAIEKQLKAKGIKVARRTIAKYRDQLGILPSHLRKRHN